MAYLHYTYNTAFLNGWFDRVDRKALANDARICSMENLAEDYRRTFQPVPDGLAFTLGECKKRRRNLSAVLDQIAEEEDWRSNPGFLIDSYANFGYVLRFVCANQEFETEREALAEARIHCAYNDMLLDIGPDGSGMDDMLPPGRIVQAVFTKRSID